MRVCLYSPYFGTATGGGEAYLGQTAEAIRDRFSNAAVEILSPVPVDAARYRELLGLDLRGIRLRTPNPRPGSWKRRLARVRALRPLRDAAVSVQMLREAAGADVFIDMVYRMPVLGAGRRRVLLVQFPHRPSRTEAAAQSVAAALSRGRVGGGHRRSDIVVCQSDYVRGWIDRMWGQPAAVVHPPVGVPDAEPDYSAKERRILTVGRFVVGGHQKRHDVLVRAFRRLVDAGLEGWHLDVAGSVQRDDRADLAYLDQVRELAVGYPVTIHVDVPAVELEHLYVRASIYWHAAGFGVDAERRPSDVEHFGMTIVEAMGRGAVPVALAAGGVPEIVEEGVSGLLWRDLDHLESATRRLLVDRAVLDRMARAARERSRAFTRAVFRDRMTALLAPLLES